ncbi:MAG: hypothetical protein ACK6DC_22365 [Planctomycetota bacterium]
MGLDILGFVTAPRPEVQNKQQIQDSHGERDERRQLQGLASTIETGIGHKFLVCICRGRGFLPPVRKLLIVLVGAAFFFDQLRGSGEFLAAILKDADLGSVEPLDFETKKGVFRWGLVSLLNFRALFL